MSQHTLEIEARPQPEIMERILRVTRHRGFALKSMQLDTLESSSNLVIRMTVSSERAIEQLCNQINKLIDVARVEELIDSQLQKRA
jgi:acetolactate synthase II small subunit